jgi:hypothetical protein
MDEKDHGAVGVIAAAIREEVAHPLGSMRLLPESEEELAEAIVAALACAGLEIVRRAEQPPS